jgi:hypothetical protein
METGRTLREGTGVVTGWRAWVVMESPEGLRLGSVLHDLAWTPGRTGLAECRREDDPFALPIPAHPVPGIQCNCGFHAARDPADALSYARGRDEASTVCRILGEVHLWGHVLETEGGWRASHAYPARLYVADSEVAAALAAYGVPVCGSPSSRTCTGMPSPSARHLPIWRNVAART